MAPQTDATLQVTISAKSMQNTSKVGNTIVVVSPLTPP
jgi:hypothetical protein